MSQELPSNNNNKNEEVDLIMLIGLISNGLSNIFSFFINIFKTIFSSIIRVLKVLLKKWKLIIGSMLLAAILGFALEQTRPTTYNTSMLVEPYFNSKYQLVNNIGYFNALISNKDIKALKSIFKVEEDIIESVIGFSIEPGPETENDRILQYEEFIAKLDSVRAQEYAFEEFIENRSVYSGRYFLINAYSSKPDVFKKLEAGVLSSFTNDYSDKEMERRDTLIEIQRQNLKDQLKQVDSLKKIYIKVLQDDSSTSPSGVKVGDIVLSAGNDKQPTREYDLLREEQKIRNELKTLDGQKVEEDVVFDVISTFQKVGNITQDWKEKYSIIFPILTFLLLMLFFFAKKAVNYTLTYEE